MTFETKFRNFAGKVQNYSKEEIVVITKELLREMNNDKQITINGWKGKSSFTFNEIGDRLIVTKYQKPEKGAEPKEVKYEIDMSELRKIEVRIKMYFRFNKNIPEKEGRPYLKSTQLAEDHYQQNWKEIFNNRKIHNKFTIILNVLDKKGFIEYKGGIIYLR